MDSFFLLQSHTLTAMHFVLIALHCKDDEVQLTGCSMLAVLCNRENTERGSVRRSTTPCGTKFLFFIFYFCPEKHFEHFKKRTRLSTPLTHSQHCIHCKSDFHVSARSRLLLLLSSWSSWRSDIFPSWLD